MQAPQELARSFDITPLQAAKIKQADRFQLQASRSMPQRAMCRAVCVCSCAACPQCRVCRPPWSALRTPDSWHECCLGRVVRHLATGVHRSPGLTRSISVSMNLSHVLPGPNPCRDVLQLGCVQLGDPGASRHHWPRYADLRVNSMSYRPYGRQLNVKVGANIRDEAANIGALPYVASCDCLCTALLQECSAQVSKTVVGPSYHSALQCADHAGRTA